MITFEPPTPSPGEADGGQHAAAGVLPPLQISSLFVFPQLAFDSASQFQKQLSETVCSFAFFTSAIIF